VPESREDYSVKRVKETGEKIETVSPPARRHRSVIFIALLLSATAAFALLTFLANTTPYFPIDLEITRAIQSINSPVFLGFMRLVSWPGFLPQSILITVLIACAFYLYGLYWESVMSLLASIASGTINSLVKVIIQRPRPGADLVDVFEILMSFSFPSGHVMFYTILSGFTSYLVFILLKASLWRNIILGIFGSFILLVGVSRIYLGQHWASDVLGAYLLGGLILVGLIALYQWGKKRFFVHQPSAPPNSNEE
jgi:undecaprenyl-diphosphatase